VTAERHLITGANGQDGGYLVEALLAAGEQVHGICHTWQGLERFTAEHPGATGHIGDLGDAVAIVNLIADIRPTRIYNLAGNTSVRPLVGAPGPDRRRARARPGADL
jgi:GDPmannose 4,6-dehydratase